MRRHKGCATAPRYKTIYSEAMSAANSSGYAIPAAIERAASPMRSRTAGIAFRRTDPCRACNSLATGMSRGTDAAGGTRWVWECVAVFIMGCHFVRWLLSERAPAAAGRGRSAGTVPPFNVANFGFATRGAEIAMPSIERIGAQRCEAVHNLAKRGSESLAVNVRGFAARWVSAADFRPLSRCLLTGGRREIDLPGAVPASRVPLPTANGRSCQRGPRSGPEPDTG